MTSADEALCRLQDYLLAAFPGRSTLTLTGVDLAVDDSLSLSIELTGSRVSEKPDPPPRGVARVRVSAASVLRILSGAPRRSNVFMQNDSCIDLPDGDRDLLTVLEKCAADPTLQNRHDSLQEKLAPIHEPPVSGDPLNVPVRLLAPDEVVDVLHRHEWPRGLPDNYRITPLGEGRIHQVFKVQRGRQTFILQRINDRVVPPLALAEATSFVLERLGVVGEPELWPDGSSVVYDDPTGYWLRRAYIPGSRPPDPVTLSDAARIARALRCFHDALAGQDLPVAAQALVDPWSQSDRAADAEAVARLAPPPLGPGSVLDYGWLEARRLEVAQVRPGGDEVGRRIIHRDPRPANCVFAFGGGALFVDYDTIGVGRTSDDLAELLRALILESHAVPTFTLSEFAHLAQAVLIEYGLQPGQVEHLLRQTAEHAELLGHRFLSDFILGRNSFREAYPGENLSLVRANIALSRELRDQPSARDQVLYVYAGAPNEPDGRLSPDAAERADLLMELLCADAHSIGALTGGYGAHFNESAHPHYEYVHRRLGLQRPDVVPRIVACVPTAHSYQDAQTAVWLGLGCRASEVVLVTSEYHVPRMQLLLEILAKGRLPVRATARPVSEREVASRRGTHELEARLATATAALLFGTESVFN